MTSPPSTPLATSTPDMERGRQQVTLGIGLIAAAAIGLAAFENIARRQFIFTATARAAMIVLLGLLVFRGRRWAAWLFGFFALAGVLAGVVGLLGTRSSPVGLMLFAPIVGANVGGLALLFLSTTARAFLSAQQALADRAKRPPAPPIVPND